MQIREITRLRKEKKWTQTEAAKMVGISKAAYSNLETGHRKPSYDLLIRLLDLFECDDPRKLFGAATPAIRKEPDGNPANESSTPKE